LVDVEAGASVNLLYRALASGYNPALRAFVPIAKAELRRGAAALDHLISPHGSRLVDLVVDQDRAAEIRAQSRDWPSVDLGPRQLCDLELLINGGYSPLDRYLGSADHQTVCSEMRLADGTLWPLPVALNISTELADSLAVGDALALRDGEGVMIAALEVDECYRRDLDAEVEAVFGTAERSHGAVAQYLHRTRPWAVAGRVEALQLPVHYDYRELRRTPADLRSLFSSLGWRQVLSFQTHRTIHRGQLAMTVEAARNAGTNILIHPVVGLDQPGDADHYTRVRCYQDVLPHFPESMVRLNLLPLAMRGGGAREALLHAIVHKNYGSSHLMIDFDGAGTVLDTVGEPAYQQEEAREIIAEHVGELGVELLPKRDMVYLEPRKQFVAADDVPADGRALRLTADEVRQRLDDGREIPSWYTFEAVARELQRRHPARSAQGFTVFLTGLSGSGKSTIANVLRVKLLELGGRGVALLDGDLVRANLSSELGFSKEHRDLNIRRIGFVAAEITRAGGVAICAPIAPYDVVRREVREMVQPCGGFVLVHVATPLEVCEARDRKGMYAKARAGIIKEFTGISDPYEVPEDADVVIDTSDLTPAEATREVLLQLQRQGFISVPDEG
jgi:sulfate adenylyltransferase